MENVDLKDWFEDEGEKLKKIRIEFPNLNLVNQKWEILNFIASYRYRGDKVCVSDVYHGLDYPRESIIRAIESLVNFGIIIKSEDKIDKRRKNIKLTDNKTAFQNYINNGFNLRIDRSKHFK